MSERERSQAEEPSASALRLATWMMLSDIYASNQATESKES